MGTSFVGLRLDLVRTPGYLAWGEWQLRFLICPECRTRVDSCWRWCPECGSLELVGPEGAVLTMGVARWRADDYAVEWEMEGDGPGRFGESLPARSPA